MAIVSILFGFTLWENHTNSGEIVSQLSDVNSNIVKLTDEIKIYERDHEDFADDVREQVEEVLRIVRVSCTHVANGSTEARWACLGGRLGE